MKFLILTFAALLVGCDPQLPSKVSAQSDQLATINQRMTALEGRMSTLEQSAQKPTAGSWILWQVIEAVNAGYPQAMGGYSSKGECTTAADSWTYPDGKATKLAFQDPIIFQMKGYRVRLECLPVGTTPYAH
jgi:hypothetical protein